MSMMKVLEDQVLQGGVALRVFKGEEEQFPRRGDCQWFGCVRLRTSVSVVLAVAVFDRHRQIIPSGYGLKSF